MLDRDGCSAERVPLVEFHLQQAVGDRSRPLRAGFPSTYPRGHRDLSRMVPIVAQSSTREFKNHNSTRSPHTCNCRTVGLLKSSGPV